MSHFSIPTCYFPSTVLFLDDNRDFLLNFVLYLDEGLAYRLFDLPHKALEYLRKKRCELELLNQHCFTESATKSPATQHTINLDLMAIHQEVYNPHRFSEISVVVVDYAMPGMDGLEFCRRIENSHIKKILLTGHADETLALAAFNEGLIHRYIKKGDVNAAEQITKSIHELQLHYFQEMSEMITHVLSLKSPCCFQEKLFSDFFHQLQKEKKIIEYYLVDHSGSFLMLDDDANVSFLLVKNEKDMGLHSAFAKEHQANAEVLDSLFSKEKIPTFWPARAMTPRWEDWLQSLVPARRLVGRETYYYAYLPGSALFDVRQKKILSYHRYLEEVDAAELLIEAT